MPSLSRAAQARSLAGAAWGRQSAPIIDFFEMHMSKVEEVLGQRGIHQAARLHGVGDIKRYNNRMAAVEFTIEHMHFGRMHQYGKRGLDRSSCLAAAIPRDERLSLSEERALSGRCGA